MSFIIQNLSSDKGEIQAARRIGATQPLIMVDGLLRGDGEGGVSQAIAGTDYVDVSEADYNVKGLRAAAYNKEIISSTADALFPLTASSGIYANTGVNTTSNKYCRSGFHYAASRMLILGLDEYEWCSWCYSSNQWGTQTHSNTNGEYISGLNAIYVAPQSGDNRYVVSFRRVDGATLTTDTSDPTSDFYKIQHAFRVFECQIDNVITNVAYQNEYTYNYGLDIAKKYGTFETATKNGVTFSWDNERCHVSGTSTSQATYTIYDSRTSLPPELNPGDWLMMDYQPSVETVKLRYYIAFWKSGDTSDPVFSKLDMIPRGFVVPDNAVGITLQIRVPSSTTIDRYVNKIRLVKVRPQYTEPRLLVSFVDDDTSGLTYVQRYHDACRHNGIFGNYAVLTTYPEQSQTMKETLLGYEDEGFGTLIHAYRQSSDDPWQTMGSDESKIEQCRAVLAKGLRQMRDMGFANYNYWVSPYGIKGPQAVRIAKDLGVECLISTNNFRHNDMMAYNPYYIKRVALRQDDNGDPDLKNTLADVKAAIDAAAASTSGAWIIITTHFNEWGDLTWDDTTDENGYPVGYARFNEMVQYAINAGLTPVTVPEGWTLYKPILTANKNLIDHAGATTSGQTTGALIGGGSKNVSANEIVAATNRMTPEQAAQTRQNIGAGEPLTPEQIAEGAGAWLEDNLATPSTPPIDSSLSVTNAAADAKATGDAVGVLEVKTNDLQENITDIQNDLVNVYEIEQSTNLADPDQYTQGAIKSNGTISTTGAYADYITTDFIPLEENTDYTASVWYGSSIATQRIIYLMYTSKESPVSATYDDSTVATHLTFNSSSYKFVRISVIASVNLMVSKGTTYNSFVNYYKKYRIDCLLGDAAISQVKGIINDDGSGQVILKKNGNDINVISNLDGKTLNRSYRLTNNGTNKTFNFRYAHLDANLMKGCTDDITPLRIAVNTNETATVGANHGWAFAYKTAKGDFDSSDIGSVWSDGTTEYTLLSVFNDYAYFVPPVTKENNIIKCTAIAPGGNLTHVSGATHTGSVARENLSKDQLYPSINNRSIALFADGEEITENGTYYPNEIIINESYGIMDLYELYTYARANVGSVDFDNVQALCTLTFSIKITGDSEIVYTNLKAEEFVKLGECGFLQSTNLTANGGTFYRYINGVESGVFASDSLVDMTNYNTNNNIMLSDVKTGQVPNRSVDLCINNGSVLYGFALGYIPDIGDGSDENRSLNTWLWDMRNTKKSYPVCVYEKTMESGEQVNVVGYRKYFGAVTDATDKFVVVVGNKKYAVFDAHSSVSGGMKVGVLGEKIETVNNDGMEIGDFINANGIPYTSNGNYSAFVAKV